MPTIHSLTSVDEVLTSNYTRPAITISVRRRIASRHPRTHYYIDREGRQETPPSRHTSITI